MKDKEIYKYTIKDLQTELQKARTTILNIINKLDLKESAEYYNKVKENGRDKTYYTQKLLDKLKEYINNTEKKEDIKTEMGNNTSLEKSIINDLREQIKYLNTRLEKQDEQIKELHQIIAIKEQTELAKEKLRLLDSPEQKKEKLSFWQRLFKRNKKEEVKI